QDMDLAAEDLFRAVSNFKAIERLLVRRGVDLRRQDRLAGTAVGMRLQLGFDWRAHHREMVLELTQFDPPEALTLEGSSDQFNLSIRMTVVALTRTKSRLLFETEAQPRGMKARILLQTAKLGKSQLDRKFARHVGDLVTYLLANT